VPAVAATPRVLQSHFVPGRGAYPFTLEPGPGAEIVDLEGLQRAVLFVVGSEGIFGLDGPAAPSEMSLHALAAEYCDAEGRAVVAAACAQGFDRARAYRLFADDGLPRRRSVVRADAPVRCLLLAPGEKMSPEQQRPPTMLQLILSAPAAEPPAPLAQAML
jgi:aminomethyltransferase